MKYISFFTALIAVSISLFFILGVEELPYPENAIIFHSEGIVKSLG